MSSNKIILSYPFSASLYAFFDQQINLGSHTSAIEYHPYYQTLFGKHFREATNLTLTLALLYENIVVAPVDAPLPEMNHYASGGEYNNPLLGLTTSSWDDHMEFSSHVEGQIDEDLQDPVVQSILRDDPGARQILFHTRYDMHLSDQYNCPIFCAGERRELIRRLHELDNKLAIQQIDESSLTMVEEYLDITGLMFQPKDIDSLYALKADNDLRAYAASFVSIMEGFRGERNVRKQLLLSIRDALEKASFAEKASGIFNASSVVLSILGFIPIVGPFLSGGALLGTGASHAMSRRQRKQEWYELAPQVERISSLHEIRKKLESELS